MLNPKYPDLHNFRGVVLCELERYGDSQSAFRRSAALHPTHLLPRLNLAFSYLREGRADEAEAELRTIVEQDPAEPVARAKLEELCGVRPGDRPVSVART